MHPAYELGKFQIQSYGFHFVLSCVAMILALAILLRIRDQNAAPAIDLALLLILGQVVVAKVLWNLLNKEHEFISGIPKFRSGFWGGQLGFGLLAGLYLLWSRAPLRPLADALGVAWAFSSVLHKIGCFMAGCCYGSPTTLPWGVVFPPGGGCGLPGQSLHPSQLYDAVLSFVAGLFLLRAFLGRKWEGRLLLLSAFLYAVCKYATEWTRGDARYLVVGPASAAMAVELVTAAVCALLLTKPAAWNFVLALRELRTAAARVPEATVRRGVAFALTLGNAIGAVFSAMLAAAVTRNEVLAAA